MDLFEYFRIAWETLLQNKFRSLLTMLGVIIGVMSVIVLVALGEAAQTYVENEFVGLGSNLILVTPGKQETTGMAPVVAGSFRSLTSQDALKVARRAQGVTRVAPLVMGAGAVRYRGLLRDAMVLGATEDWTEVRSLYPRIGRFITRQDVEKNNAVVVLGAGIKEGLFGDKNALYEKVTINRRKFNVIGVMEDIGMTFDIDMD
ncbi:MAG: ABC transporter permease, partial [Candidatus Hydrogenedentes bacterium]|nr:ABC transporter permease [Candidatus Hydrogenedentota bacterium]